MNEKTKKTTIGGKWKARVRRVLAGCLRGAPGDHQGKGECGDRTSGYDNEGYTAISTTVDQAIQAASRSVLNDRSVFDVTCFDLLRYRNGTRELPSQATLSIRESVNSMTCDVEGGNARGILGVRGFCVLVGTC